jgi:hypothetical protein
MPISRTSPIRDTAQNASAEHRGAVGRVLATFLAVAAIRDFLSATVARVAGWQTMAAANNAEWSRLEHGAYLELLDWLGVEPPAPPPRRPPRSLPE